MHKNFQGQDTGSPKEILVKSKNTPRADMVNKEGKYREYLLENRFYEHMVDKAIKL